jgi:hypothetical protein
MDVVAAGHPGALIGVAWACSVAPVVIDHRTLNASARRFAFVAWQCSRRIYHALAVFTKAIGDGALERRGRGIGDLGLASFHGHWRANSSVRASKCHIRRVILAGDVVVARGAIIAVEDAAGESRSCANVNVHRSTSLRCEMEHEARSIVLRNGSGFFVKSTEQTGAVLPWNVQLNAAKEPSINIAPPYKCLRIV